MSEQTPIHRRIIYDPETYIQELETKLSAAQAQIAALERGEFICSKCGLRKDGEHENGDF